MKRHNFLLWAGAVYLILIGIVIGIILHNQAQLYGSVNVIETQADSLRQKSFSIPIRIEIASSRLGNCTIYDETAIQKIWQAVEDIRNSPAGEVSNAPTQADEVRLSGRIYYLDGGQDIFQFSQEFRINQHAYTDDYARPLIHSLENDLLQRLYSRERIATLILTVPQVRLYEDSGQAAYALDTQQRQELSHAVKGAERIQGQRQVSLLTQENNPEVHIRLELTTVRRPEEVQAADLINLDLYENGCLAVQYMGDANARQIYYNADLMGFLSLGRDPEGVVH